MVDINQYVNQVKSLLDDGTVVSKRRGRLSMSKSGTECLRDMAYDFRLANDVEVSKRTKRIWDRGHREEPVIIEALKSIGILVFDEQIEVSAAYGHAKGHIDGKCLNIPGATKTVHLLEMKTMKQERFKILAAKGLEISNPLYYAQAQRYMRELELYRCLHITVNKNTDELHIERLRYNPDFADELAEREIMIVASHKLPAKINTNPTFYICKMCDFLQECHYKKEIKKTCRSCRNVSIQNGGQWKCELHDIILDIGQQHIGCDKYEFDETYFL